MGATVYLPGPLMNLMADLNRELSLLEGGKLRERFHARLLEIPHADQSREPLTLDAFDESVDYVPTADDDGHLESVWRWFAITLLIDPRLGVLHAAGDDRERTGVYHAADLLYRRSTGNPPPQEEWEVAEVLDNIPEGEGGDDEELTDPLQAAWAAAAVEMGMLILVENLTAAAARSWKGTPASEFDRGELIQHSLIGRVLDGGLTPVLNLLGRAMGRSFSGGNPAHHVAQGWWLLMLMDLPWEMQDEPSQAMLQAALGGDVEKRNELRSHLSAQGVDAARVARIDSTLERLAAMKAILASEEATRCLAIAAACVERGIAKAAEEAAAENDEADDESPDDEE